MAVRDRLPRLVSALLLAALGTYACGAFFALALTRVLPPEDGASGLGWLALLDPFVQSVLFLVTMVATVPIALLALWALRGRDLGVGFAFGVACVAAATLAGLLVEPRAGLAGAFAGLVVWVLVCRFTRSPWLGEPRAAARSARSITSTRPE